MKIALIDSFADTSHLKWARGLQQYSRHEIDLFIGDAHNWKWKMTGGTYDLIDQVNQSNTDYDLFLVTDMVNLPLLVSNLRSSLKAIPIAVYFHENQITYPWSPDDQDVTLQRDHHYGWINYTSARLADKIFFNSKYHKESFLGGLPSFLKQFPKFNYSESITQIENKSSILPIGCELTQWNKKEVRKPTFIWNHRWEYDKNPSSFFNALFQLSDSGVDFDLIVLGKGNRRTPKIFDQALSKLDNHIIHWGWASIEHYNALLQKANILLVTNIQDFFGISIVEAIAAGCYPILPNRLSYPEHIAIEQRSENLYEKDIEIVPKLTEVIEKKLYLNSDPYSAFVQKYAWPNLKERYDDELELCLQNRA